MDDLEPILQRARRRTVWIAAIGAVVGGIGGLALALTDDHGLHGVLTVIGFACGVGGIAGALSLILTVSTYSPDLRVPLAGLDRATRSRINRSIRAGVPVAPPDGELARRGADRARALALLLPYQTAQLALLYVGIGGVQLPQLTSDDPWQFWFSRIFLLAIVLVGAFFALFTRRKVAAARRYLRAVEAQRLSSIPNAGSAPSVR
ncbi:hypothetical protein [Curtobacterium sp. MCBA15_001]|uniref:hypothetical protein n=1 Tax=Curtobacterium sp. MCBA15_001 TaxID=1898731 RepID=UPI0008DD0AAB|nr:hypothetical protein [Curtobacterium sp. MCBA15_001]OIH92836.1 hypothetical protein BIU90_10105 [Curtobacterium sp. MCBA15_001]